MRFFLTVSALLIFVAGTVAGHAIDDANAMPMWDSKTPMVLSPMHVSWYTHDLASDTITVLADDLQLPGCHVDSDVHVTFNRDTDALEIACGAGSRRVPIELAVNHDIVIYRGFGGF